MKFQTTLDSRCSPESLTGFAFRRKNEDKQFRYKDGLRVLLVFIIFWASVVIAQEPDLLNNLRITSVENDIHTEFYDNRFEPILESWSDDKTPYIALGTAIGASFLLDGIISSDTNWVARTGNWLGDKEGLVTLTLVPILLGKMFEYEHVVEGSLVAVESMVYAGLTTQAIKMITGRTRPDGSDDMSFLSGHVSSVTAFAASISEWYNWKPEIAVPLHILPLITAYARVASDKHHESDVFAGFILGEVIGILNTRWRKSHDIPLQIEPLPDNSVWGMMITYRF